MKKITALFLAIAVCCVTLSSCANTSYIATVDGEKVKINLYVGLLSQYKYQLEQNVQQQGSTLDDVWTTKVGSTNLTWDSYLQQNASDSVIYNYMVDSLMKKNNIEFPDSERQKVLDYLTQSVESYGGRTSMESNLRNFNMTYTDYEELMIAESKKSKLFEAFYEKDGKYAVPDQEIKDYAEKTYARVKQILVSTVDTTTGAALSDDKKAEKKALAEQYLTEAKKSDEAFTKLIDEKSEDTGKTSYKDGYVFDSDGNLVDNNGTLMSDFTDASFGLQTGAVTMIETTYGYHIIKRYSLFKDDSDFTTNKSTYLAKYKSNDFQKLLDDEKASHKIVFNSAAIKKYDVKTLKVGTAAASEQTSAAAAKSKTSK